MLTHHESHVLALIGKWQPTTAYFVRKTLQRSLATTFSDSPGSIYPIIERLRRQGHVAAVAIVEDRRGTELLAVTESGIAAIRDWLLSENPADLLPEDPWRTRSLFLDRLAPGERLRWFRRLREQAREEHAAIARRAETTEDPDYIAALDNARLLTEARLSWIDRLIVQAVTSPDDG